MIAEEQKLKGTLSGGQSLAGSMKDIPSVDKTLTKEGYAADSKAVGDALATKANEIHQHTKEDITDFPKSLPASDVYDWAKQPQKPSYTASEVKARPDNWMPTAEQVGARPNTWMPSATDVGAHPNTWMPTPEQIGAAPASGFEGYYDCATSEDFNAKIEELTAAQPKGTEKTYYIYRYWYANSPLPFGRWSVTIHKPNILNEEWASVIATAISSRDILVMRRELYSGEWLEWEYENPPMKLGVEYRTTERHDSKAVYTLLDGVGSLPNTSQKVWEHGLGATEIIRYSGTTSASGAAIPYHYEGKEINLACDRGYVVLTTNFDAAYLGAYYVQLWYTKD